MRLFVAASSLAALVGSALPCLSAAPPPAAANGGPGTLVIVFKDGHRQTYNLSEIQRVEFPGAGTSADENTPSGAPSRGRFVGKWSAGDGNGGMFTIRLEENGDAYRSIGNVHGRWEYVDGEAQITWDDGAQDALRKVGSKFQKFAYSKGKLFSDVPDNVTGAHNTTPHPI